MAEIEDVAGASGGASQNVLCARLQLRPVGEKKNWIKIALHGAFVIEARPTFVERDAPIESNDVRSSLFHGGQQGGAVGTEINNGYSSFLQLLHHGGDVGKDVAAIVFHAEASDPAVENLDDVGPGAHLIGGIGGGHRNQLAHQCVPVSGRVVHHFLGVDVVARASTFDHVAGEGEGSAAESDDGERSPKCFATSATASET